jgi:enamine deaminase RidA (YjgF/YER057c/UK114 family)
MIEISYPRCKLQYTCFAISGGNDEYHLILHPEEGDGFEVQCEAVKNALRTFLAEEAGNACPVFMRWFLSDAANQQEIIERDSQSCAVSIIEQPPLDGTKVALWAYIIKGTESHRAGERTWEAEYHGFTHLWTAKECRGDGDTELQTRAILESYESMLQGRSCRMADNCIRTWFFVQNVDVNYGGVVKGRRDFFNEIGLTSHTHYIASTGIAGRVASPSSTVIFDSYAVRGLGKDRIHFLKGSSHLNPTYEYGVTFERGTVVDYADRSHVFISGTASIDNKGQIVCPSDIKGQVLRMWENVEVLLQEADCSYEDVMHMMVYLRDISDYQLVSRMYEERFPSYPKVFLWAPVCRPGWLVEMECMAVRKRL